MTETLENEIKILNNKYEPCTINTGTTLANQKYTCVSFDLVWEEFGES